GSGRPWPEHTKARTPSRRPCPGCDCNFEQICSRTPPISPTPLVDKPPAGCSAVAGGLCLTQTVFLPGRWTPPIRARVIAASGALAAAGRAVTVIAPVSPSECGLPDAVGFVPARRRDDAAHALE